MAAGRPGHGMRLPDGLQGVDLTRAVPAVVAHSALAGLRSATIDGREEGVRRRVTRAWNRVSRLLQRCSRRLTRFHARVTRRRSEEHTSELQSPDHLECRLLLEKKKQTTFVTNQAHTSPRR